MMRVALTALTFLAFAVNAGTPLFRDVAGDVGLRFVHENGATGQFYYPELIGSGGALFDYDNDGDLDVFLVQSGELEQPTTPSAQPSPPSRGRGGQTSRLYRNDLDPANPKSLRFTDVTEHAGAGLRAYGMGTAVGDTENDGDLDLLVTAFGSTTLFRNNGNGTFTDATKEAGVGDPRWSTSAAFADYDRDGDLDLFVVNYVDFAVTNNKICYEPLGSRDYCAPRAFNPVPARLLQNDGSGRFSDVTQSSGVARAFGRGLGVATGDFNGDGWIDFYVANDASGNQLWMNKHDGTFEDLGLLSGTAVSGEGRPEGSMGIASGDYDADGDEDLLITNLVGETFALYVNDGRGNFEDRRRDSGLASATAEMTGFGVDWFDYDRDGRLDLLIANGAVNAIARQRGHPQPFRQRRQLFHNEGQGRFREVNADAGPAFVMLEVGRGAAFGDVDHDGDVDALITNNDGPVRLLLNEAAPDAHWLSVQLDNGSKNRWGVGARVGIERSGQPTLWRRVRSDGSYLSASDLRAHFGLGTSPAVAAVIVEWPDGSRERFTDVGVNTRVTLRRGTGKTF
jgi:hypothetical protein